MKQGLGTQLRHLIDLLDGDVAAAYDEAGLAYRPRYTPVMRVLGEHGSASIGEVAAFAGITQPAATQTVALMRKEGLVAIVRGRDARQRLVTLSAQGQALLPQLQVCWAATARAAASLDAELAFPLSQCLAEAIAALQATPYIERIRAARINHHKEPS
ncbi:MarR family winged helix-turn-helix transcriptional regulator [Massilia sp. DWR3-1-1]|uniref:MarR family winged helix-turn-helix transcriptional regulator n=1 Tax=Massilia sp. DWR3-1-1 TaxID=2804559 RepID=UPI003CEA1E14